jgi:hypothetical protein
VRQALAAQRADVAQARTAAHHIPARRAMEVGRAMPSC